jgi:TPR repeat protein
MRRQDIHLLSQARRGDAAARCEVGRRYLLGMPGFPRHVAVGLAYLQPTSPSDDGVPARLIAEILPLHELVALDQLGPLEAAAQAGSLPAMVKFGVWCLAQGQAQGPRWLSAAAGAGHAGARLTLEALAGLPQDAVLSTVLQQLSASGDIDGTQVVRLAARQALARADLLLLASCLGAALQAPPGLDDELVLLVVAAVQLAESTGQVLQGLPGAALRDSLEQRASQGDRDAAFTLGRGASAMACDALPDEVFAEHKNMRKGAAFLMRAADAGCDAAWLCLYRLHADHQLSVANPQLARFFLEKAALCGQGEAQRRLGALLLRESTSLDQSEQAIAWLHQAAAQGDDHASALLFSLVLPVEEGDAEAAFGIEQVRRSDPWLALRLTLARAFGLTKLEALTVDPVEGQRTWGLVVGKNPFISQVRLSAARAVPAITPQALEAAQDAAAFFGQSHGEANAAEGDLRARSLRQRRMFDRLELDEAMYFSNANSMTLESLRLGAKWAFRSREPLKQALMA